MPKAKFGCAKCGRVFETERGLNRHHTVTHGKNIKTTKTVKKNRQMVALERIQEHFPKGIPTGDLIQLSQDLYFVDELRRRS